ncbi:hypothetical protein Hanom_Chr16g01435001 [Helianthus anomalus]
MITILELNCGGGGDGREEEMGGRDVCILCFEKEEEVRRVGRVWKRWEGIGPCLREEEDAQRFEDIF